MANDETNNTEQADRVYNLTKDLIAIQRAKKDSNAGYNEEIKRLKKEIEEILKEDEGEADRAERGV